MHFVLAYVSCCLGLCLRVKSVYMNKRYHPQLEELISNVITLRLSTCTSALVLLRLIPILYSLSSCSFTALIFPSPTLSPSRLTLPLATLVDAMGISPSMSPTKTGEMQVCLPFSRLHFFAGADLPYRKTNTGFSSPTRTTCSRAKGL